MYLHECYLIPKATLDAIVKHLEDQPFKVAAPLLNALNGTPNGSAEAMKNAGVLIHHTDTEAMVGRFEESPVLSLKEIAALEAKGSPPLEFNKIPTPGETVVEFPAGVARRE